MTECVAFHSCSAARAAGFAQGFIEPADQVGRKGSARVDTTSPLLSIEAMPIDTATAWHEAGHAVAGELEGFRLTQIQIEHPYVTRFEPRADAVTVRQALRQTLAGPIAERWRDRHVHRADDETLLFYLRAIRARTGGRCDLCQAFGYVLDARPDDDDATALHHFRAIETETIEIVTSRAVTAMLRTVAAQLMETPTMVGDEFAQSFNDFSEMDGLLSTARL